MVVELILRPDLGKGAYRLRCRFTVDAPPRHLQRRAVWAQTLEKMKLECAQRFVNDMAKRGWEYMDKHGFQMTGPYHGVQVVDLSKLRRQHFNTRSPDFWHRNGLGPESAVTTLPSLQESDKWDYELSAVFIHKTLLAEIPDPIEEKETLNRL